MMRRPVAAAAAAAAAQHRASSTDDADVAAGEAAAAAAAEGYYLLSGASAASNPSPPPPPMTYLSTPQRANYRSHNGGANLAAPILGSSVGGVGGPSSLASDANNSISFNSGGGAGASSGSDFYLSSAPSSMNSFVKAASDLDFFEDLISEPVLVLGFDISHLSRNAQFVVCALGVFWFSLLYGYLQELISVQLCNRRLGLFLAAAQFAGYTVLAYILRNFVYAKEKRLAGGKSLSRASSSASFSAAAAAAAPSYSRSPSRNPAPPSSSTIVGANRSLALQVPFLLYLGLSLLRAVDLGMTNLAMQYINYPAKTLLKSSRVVFTMLFGVVISRKSYGWRDYAIVVCMCAGLALFMHADATSSAVFHHMGVVMLIVSLVCDGAITNMSESIMKQFGVGQDEFIFRMYSIALVAITAAAAWKGDLREGLVWMTQPGTYDELSLPVDQRTWSVSGKLFCLVVFSSMGFFGSSCSAAITKNFGALTMSITSTARKAVTLFLSFFVFGNVCTGEHLLGIVVFIAALTAKSLRRRGAGDGKGKHKRRKHRATPRAMHQLELQMGGTSSSSAAAAADSEGGGSYFMPTKNRNDEYENLIRRTASHESGGPGAAATIDPRDVHIV